MAPLSIYVAGSFENRDKIKEIIKKLKEMGWLITHDWTVRADTIVERTNEELAESAKLDFMGVLSADYTLFIMDEPEYVYRGTFFELGTSLARDMLSNSSYNKKRTILYGPKNGNYASTCCFYHIDSKYHFEKMEDVYNFLKKEIN